MSARRRTLNGQLLWLGALPAALMFIGLMVFFTTARLSDARTDLFTGTQVMADNLAPALEYAVVSGNIEVLQQVIERSISNSGVEWIRVTDIVGNELGSVFREGVQADASRNPRVHLFDADILQQPLALGSHGQTEWFEPEYRLTGGALNLGSVEVAVSERVLDEKRFNILLTSGVVGISLLVFTLLLVNRLLTPVIEPIRDLAERVRELTNRTYRDTGPPGKHHVAEIAELETSLNALARHLLQLKEAGDHTLAVSESARQKAESASRTKSEFLAVMSHELRTPLNGVLGMLDLVEDEELTPAQRDYTETARRSTHDLLTLINDILDYSQLDQGNLLLTESVFDPKEVVINCLTSFRHLAAHQGLLLEVEEADDWPVKALVTGDPVRFRQLVSSLVDNALKFSDHGTITVRLSWHQEDNRTVFVSCEVSDNGRGIPADRLADIFNTFEQLDSSSTRTVGGTGIGLALVQKLVELLGGHISVQTSPGEGSSFRFEIPFERGDGGDTHPDTPARRSSSPRSAPEPAPLQARPAPKALVVEDNVVNRRVIRALLERLGFETVSANHGRQAVDCFSAHEGDFAVVLMDCQMPVMDGYEASEAIRRWEQDQDCRPVPIIALTADVLPGTETACKAAGMNDYMAKPVRKDQLRQTLSRWVPL